MSDERGGGRAQAGEGQGLVLNGREGWTLSFK